MSTQPNPPADPVGGGNVRGEVAGCPTGLSELGQQQAAQQSGGGGAPTTGADEPDTPPRPKGAEKTDNPPAD
jgi:hypothetical protein